MSDSLRGKQVKVEIKGRVWEEDESKITVITECGACIVPRSACTVVVPEVCEGDLVEAKNGEDLVRGRVLLFSNGKIIDSDGDLRVSASWKGSSGYLVFVRAANVTILERADGSKP